MISQQTTATKFFISILAFSFTLGDAEVRCLERERESLLSFRKGLTDENGILSSWRSDDCCNWYGVVCSHATAHVTRLELGTYDFDGVLGGKVTSSLLELHHLNYLDLSLNDFGGETIPEFIGSMIQLQHLYLSKSNFSGVVPPQIRNLTKLDSLDLSFNSLRIENLDWLSSLSLLSFLDLSKLDLSHINWMQQILNLRSLQELHLQYCNMSYMKPSASLFVNSSSTSLSTLDLSNNLLTSSALDWFFNASLNHLDYLDLSYNMLECKITESLANLSRLRVLVLYDNYLSGKFDECFGNLSMKGILASLEIMDLTYNQLNGSVPDLQAFSVLKEVYFNENNFTGSVPLTLGQLSKLQVLDVSHNSLGGAVSESHLIKLDNLRVLDLSFNSLILHIAPDWNPPFQLKYLVLAGCSSGPFFPKWIQTQKKLSNLDLSSAGITDGVPMWLWSLSPSLDYISLSNNQMSGTIPDLSSTSISLIDVSSNKFSGHIPLSPPSTSVLQLSQNMFSGSISSICEISMNHVKFLDLSSNQLDGEVPNCWEKMPNLWSLNLANNSFSGEIPVSIGSLHHLAILQLSDNHLSGELPSSLRFCQELQLFDVEGNELAGTIPSWIGASHTNMRCFNFRSNRFHGSIPLEICNFTEVQILDVSRNYLSGEIPDCFKNFSSLSRKDTGRTRYMFGYRIVYQYNPQLPNMNIAEDYVGYSSVQWKGQEFEYNWNIVFLKLVDFSSNGLVGSIPESISSMRGLISLNLSKNNLTGHIIPNIGEMEMLESLDLSHNQLSGEIPSSLAQLEFLAMLNLSNNNLFGEIPTSTQLLTFNESSYVGNNIGLCGIPLPLCPKHRLRPPPSAAQGEKEGWFWRLSFIQGFCITMAFGFIVGFWGVVASLLVKKSWRYAYFIFLDDVGDWFYVRTRIFLSKWTQS